MSKANKTVFPDHIGFEYHANGAGIAWITPQGGLSQREYFAAMAMQGLCANSIPGEHHMPKNVASEAVEFADALIAELEKSGKEN